MSSSLEFRVVASLRHVFLLIWEFASLVVRKVWSEGKLVVRNILTHLAWMAACTGVPLFER